MINVVREIVQIPKIDNNYRSIEILEALSVVFKNKCYLCEIKDTSPGVFDVEHFETQKEAGHKRYNWANLYLACHICNGIKPRKTPDGGYLDVCNPDEDVESFIDYDFETLEYDKPLFSTLEESQKILNTINLLKRVHYGHDPNTRLRTASLRNAIKRQALIVLSTIYKLDISKNDDNQRSFEERNLQILFSRNSPFTMLMRSFGNEYALAHLFD